MGKKSTPAAPDYMKLAEMTAKSSQDAVDRQTVANRVNQYTPEGSMTWDQDPSGAWSQYTHLNPQAQALYDQQQRIAGAKGQTAENLVGRMQKEYGQEMDWSALSPYANVPLQAGGLKAITNASGGIPKAGATRNQYDFNNLQNVQGSDQSRQRAEDAFYKSATSRLDPQWQQQQAQMEAQLANQGITRGSAAYEKAMDQMARQRTDAYSQAQLSSITNAGAEAQRNEQMDLALRQQQMGESQAQTNLWNQMQAQRFGQGMQGATLGLQQQQQAFGQRQAAGGQNFQQQLQAAQFQNQQRQQQLTEMMQKRGFSLNEINAILTGTQVGMPNFAGYNQAGLAQSTDYTGAGKMGYDASMDAYNAAQAASPLNAAASLAGTAMKAYTGGVSDRRVKRDIKLVGRHPRGYGIYTYRFIGERGPLRRGVIAQDVAKHAPHLVVPIIGILGVKAEALEGV